jgi:hypothetical protein
MSKVAKPHLLMSMQVLPLLRVQARAHRLAKRRRHAAVAPPQLDEFLMPRGAHLRRADMAALGWDEAAVYGRPPAGP